MKYLLNFPHFYLLFLILLNSCKSSTEPEDKFKDPRDMVWIVDTIMYSGANRTEMNHLIAFSTSNIYVYGRCDLPYGQTYHYDGTSWKLFNIANQINGTNIHEIITLSSNIFYGVGENQYYKKAVFKGEGSTWSFISTPTAEGMLSICSINNRYIYVGGRNGDILYYDGIQWNYDYKRIIPEAGRNYVIRAAEAYKDTIHFLGSMWGTTKNVFYHIKGKYKDWKIVDSMVQTSSYPVIKWGDQDLYVSPTNRLFSYGYHGIWEYAGKDWKTILMCDYAINGMFSLADNYMIGCGDLGRVFYYDGTSWKLLTQFQRGYENVLYQTAWGNGKELFIVGYTEDYPMRTIIWHGK